MRNTHGKNRKSLKNEREMNNAYIDMNNDAKKKDGLDISAVIARDGTLGRGLMNPKFNRSRDDNFHIVKDFISDADIKKHIKTKKNK